jgi:hypothetical protein
MGWIHLAQDMGQWWAREGGNESSGYIKWEILE